MRKDNAVLKSSVTFAIAVALLCLSGVSHADGSDAIKQKGKTLSTSNPVILANDILNRWEPVAVAAGIHTPAWREMFLTQLSRMDTGILSGIDEVEVDTATNAKASYAKFAGAFKSALMQAYMAGQSGKGNMKLGSATGDQVFIPITPCRVVDSRNLLGPISAGFTRNYQFYASSSGVNFGTSQGGTPGAAGTVCPGAVNPNGGAPSAAVVTITVVTPSAAGNFAAWGGASPVSQTSVLNWNGAGSIAANTTVVPAGGRTGTGPGGAIQDFAIAYNGPAGQAQVVVDVVGYFVENLATALDCVETTLIFKAVAAGTLGSVSAGACPTGYSVISQSCGFSGSGTINDVDPMSDSCFGIATAGNDSLFTRRHCCRIPGR